MPARRGDPDALKPRTQERYRAKFGPDWRADYRAGAQISRAEAGHGTKPARRGDSDLFKATQKRAESRKRAREAVSLGREHGWSLSRSAKAAHTTPDNVRRWAPSAIDDRGRVKRADTEARIMPVVSSGQVYPEVAIRGSRQAGLVSAHLRAIAQYLATGDEAPLARFRGRAVNGTLPDGRKVRLELETDPDVLDALGSMGALTGLVVGS
jgi:hypothetical protein